jgi:hypothetical protein
VTLLADEGVDRQIVERLRLDGHHVAYVAEMSPGIADDAVLMESRISSSVLITANKVSANSFFGSGKRRPGSC